MTKQKDKLNVHIKTFGCQMNAYDTEVAEGVLESQGYHVKHEHEFFGEAPKKNNVDPGVDVFMMNTCSVREHAEDRVYGRLGILGKAKKKNPNLIVGLMGCMVEEHRESLFKKFPQLDLMVGTRNILELPKLIKQVQDSREQVAQIKQDGISIEYTEQIKRQGKYHAWLPVMTGCDKVCTFCIVPITRGSEVSMPARAVYREAVRLATEGVKWITLLGQNVNSYRGEEPGEKHVSFARLLTMLSDIEGIEHISFTTSHPHDATEDLYRAIQDSPKISRRFHLPLQSGSDYILKRMKRLHTYEDYLRKIEMMREMIPGISITTDIIAGFSGEREEDHQATAKALKEIRYDGAFIYKYSLREATPAAKMDDDVPLPVKEQRNQELLEIQKKIGHENNLDWVGKTVEAFVESRSVKDSQQWVARTSHEKKVVFSGDESLEGSFQKIKLESLKHETFLGRLA